MDLWASWRLSAIQARWPSFLFTGRESGRAATGPRSFCSGSTDTRPAATCGRFRRGKLEAGEASEQCARRELEEEAGLRAAELQRLTSIYTTPGFTDEQIDIYVATGLSEGRAAPESTEFIETETLPVAEAFRLIEEGEIVDSKTICSLLWTRCFTGLMDE